MRDNPGRRLRTPAKRRMRLVAPLTLLISCSLLASFASPASASNYDMRGEWGLQLSATHGTTFSGTDIINKMEPSGAYSGAGSFLSGLLPATMSGTVVGNETSLSIVADTPTEGEVTFIATKMTVETVKNEFSGSGTYYNEKGEPYETGQVKATRLKTYQEVLEREAREKKEAEERQARANIRGEWELTLKAGPQTLKAIAVISSEANSKNEFSSSSATFEGGVAGNFQGTLEGEKATVKLTNQAAAGVPAGEFTSSAMTVHSASNPTSMSGAGKLVIPELALEVPGELTAVKIHTYAEVKEREAREAREAKEAQERAEREAEAARARRAREELEAKEKAAITTTSSPASASTLLPAVLLGKAFTATRAGSVPLRLSDPNSFPIHGHIAIVLSTTVAKGSGAGRKVVKTTLGSGSFALTAGSNEAVSVKLSHTGLTILKRRHALRVTLVLTSESAGVASAIKKYAVTLRAGHRKA